MRWMVCRAAPWWTDACEDGGGGSCVGLMLMVLGEVEGPFFYMRTCCGLVFFSLQSTTRLWDGLGRGHGYQGKLGMTMGIGKME